MQNKNFLHANQKFNVKTKHRQVKWRRREWNRVHATRNMALLHAVKCLLLVFSNLNRCSFRVHILLCIVPAKFLHKLYCISALPFFWLIYDTNAVWQRSRFSFDGHHISLWADANRISWRKKLCFAFMKYVQAFTLI